MTRGLALQDVDRESSVFLSRNSTSVKNGNFS